LNIKHRDPVHSLWGQNDMRILKLCAVAMALAPLPASAATIVYNNFTNTTGLTINGDAAALNTGSRTLMRLTPSRFFKSGSVFSTNAITFGPSYGFSTRFTFNMNTQRGGGADGIVFVIQPRGNSVGGSGGGIGYGGITKSLGVEYDTFSNGAIDEFSNNHIGIDLNGSLNSLVQNNALPFIMDSGKDLTSWIDYNGTTKTIEVRLNNSNVRPLSAILSYNFDLAATIGTTNAFVGFTSGTGGGAANHDLINWEFRDSFAPIIGGAVPEPGTWGFIITGFAIVGGVLRRRPQSMRLA
jgi:Legume lectin domain